MRSFCAGLGAILVLGVLAGPARAQEESPASAAGYGSLAAVSSLVYAPLKVVYATGGLLIGGIAWAFSGGDSDVANAVITPAVRGDYVVTPGALRGEQPLEFIGREPQPQPRYD